MYEEIPFPITFNPQKHHFGYLQKEIERWKTMNWILVEKELLSIGNNLIDFYLGNLSTPQICRECKLFFDKNNINNKAEFIKWLNAPKYKKIQLTDNSEWLIKEGINPKRYIHIHPAKFSLYTIRVRATTLKTVIALNVQPAPFHKEHKTNLSEVNKIRQELLGLSPIKSLTPKAGILKLWELFKSGSLSLYLQSFQN
jgi:hypothetical protein